MSDLDPPSFSECRLRLSTAAARSETATRARNRHLGGFVALNEGHRRGYWGGAADMYRLLTGREPE